MVSKTDGIWEMTIPYNALINDVIRNRVDFNSTHARKLFAESEIDPATVNSASPQLKSGVVRNLIATHCQTTTYFPGKKRYPAELHKRDKENRRISLGVMEFKYTKDGTTKWGCRVRDTMTVYYRPDNSSPNVVKTTPGKFIFDNFIREAQNYWTIPGVFTLKLWLKGHNDADIDRSVRNLLGKKDHLTVRFATKFLPYKFNQMYKSNIIQFNNFSTMTTDGTHWHEVGHAFGLDDEYGGGSAEKGYKKNGCEHTNYQGLDALEYQMCDGGAVPGKGAVKHTIYHYIAVSLYIAN